MLLYWGWRIWRSIGHFWAMLFHRCHRCSEAKEKFTIRNGPRYHIIGNDQWVTNDWACRRCDEIWP